MGENPWFKLWARDLLTDPKVDSTPLAAMFLVVKMWCVCCLEGSCPADPEEIARKTRVTPQCVSQFISQCVPFFEERDGRLYSRRMEREKTKSDLARQSAQARYTATTSATGPAKRTADRSAFRSAQKGRKADGQKAEEEKPCGAPSQGDAASQQPALITLPLNDRTEYPIVQLDGANWQALFPAVDVMQELRNMRAWCLANPTHRKTRSGILRFVNGWLQKAQNRTPVPFDAKNKKPTNGLRSRDIDYTRGADLVYDNTSS